MKRRILIAIISGGITTGLVSFTALIVNLGFAEKLMTIWLKTWIIGCLVSIPSIIFLGPRIQKLVNQFFERAK